MRSFLFSVTFLVLGLSLGLCEDDKGAALVITANDVMTNSVRIAREAMTNVHVNFRFEGKSGDEIKTLVGRNIKKPVTVFGVDSTRTQGAVEGILVDSNNVPVGMVVSFPTRASARIAVEGLRARKP